MLEPDASRFDIKYIINELPGTATFIDTPDSYTSGSGWLQEEITINDTFIDLQNRNKMNLSKTFDGLILLRYVTPSKVNY